MQAIEPFCAHHVQVDLLVQNFCLLGVYLLVVIDDFVLAELVVKFNELF